MRRQLRDLTVHYESVGQGRPFIMLHGSPGDYRVVMQDLEPAFRGRRGWRRIYPDLPRHGTTPGSQRIRDMDGYLRRLIEFAERDSSSHEVALGGVSLGTYLVLGMARRRASTLRGLILSVAELHHGPREGRRDQREGSGSGAVAQAFMPRTRYTEDTEWLQTLPFRYLSFDLYDGRKPISVPTLLLFGRQDAFFRAREYWRIFPGFPHATFAILDGAGRAVWQEQGELARTLVRDWLDRMDSSTPESMRRRRSHPLPISRSVAR